MLSKDFHQKVLADLLRKKSQAKQPVKAPPILKASDYEVGGMSTPQGRIGGQTLDPRQVPLSGKVDLQVIPQKQPQRYVKESPFLPIPKPEDIIPQPLAFKPLPKLEPTEIIKTAPKKSFWEKAKKIAGEGITALPIFKMSDEDRKARAGVAYTISQNYNVSYEDAEKNLDAITKELGIRTSPTTMEVVEGVIKLPITYGMLTNPITVGLGIAGYFAIGEVESFVISKLKGEEYKKFQQQGLASLLPSDTNKLTKDIVEIFDFLAKAKAVHAIYQKAPQVKEFLTKRIIEEYKLPQTVFIEAHKIKDIFQTGKKISPAEQKLVVDLGLDAAGYKRAVQNGLMIEIPLQKIVTVADRPYWAKLKNTLKLKPTDPSRVVSIAEPLREAPRALLQEGVIQAPAAPVQRALPQPTISKPVIPAVDTPLADFQIVKPTNKAQITKLKNNLEDIKVVEKNLLAKPRTTKSIEELKQLQILKGVIENKLGVAEKPEIITTGPVRAPVKAPVKAPIKAPISTPTTPKITPKQPQIEAKVTEMAKVTIPERKAVKTQILTENKLRKEIIKLTDDAVVSLDTPLLTVAKHIEQYKLPSTPLTNAIQKLSKIKKNQTQPLLKLESKIKNEIEIISKIKPVSKPTAIERITPEVKVPTKKEATKKALEERMERKAEAKEKAGRFERLFKAEAEKQAKISASLVAKAEERIAKIRAEKGIKPIEKKIQPTKKQLELENFKKELVTMKNEGKTNDEFMKLYQEEFDKEVAGETLQGRTRSDIVLEFIESNKEVLFSKGKIKSIDEYAPRENRPTNQKEFKLFDETYKLIKEYTNKVSEKYTPRGVEGAYFPASSNIAVTSLTKIGTIVHEMAHRFSHMSNMANRIIDAKDSSTQEKLTDIYLDNYPGAKKKDPIKLKIEEGFAVLANQFMENPAVITGKSQELIQEFMMEKGKYYDELFAKFLREVDELVGRYQSLDAMGKVKSSIVTESRLQMKKRGNTGLDTMFKEDKLEGFTKLQLFDFQLFDSTAPWKISSKTAGVEYTAKDPRLALLRYALWNRMVSSNVNNKKDYFITLDKNGEYVQKEGPNIQTMVNLIYKTGEPENVSGYLRARDAYRMYKKLEKLEKGSDEYIAEAKKLEGEHPFEIVEEIYLKYRDKYKEIETMYKRFTDDILDLGHNTRLLNPEGYKSMKDEAGYAPRFRSILDEIGDNNQIVKTYGNKLGRVKSLIARTGSEKPVIDPVYALIVSHIEMHKKAGRQFVFNKILEMAEKDTARMHVKDYSLGDETRVNTIVGIGKDYKRKRVVMNKWLKESLDEWLNLGIKERDIGWKIGMLPGRTFRAGTTGLNFFFALFVNPSLDRLSLFINTRNKTLPIISEIKSVLQNIKGKLLKDPKETKDWDFYLNVIGGYGTLTEQYSADPSRALKDIIGKRNAIKKIAANIVRGLKLLPKYSEIIPRATEYDRAIRAGKHQLLAIEDALSVTTPFHHHGFMGLFGPTFGKELVKANPYLNPAIQVLRVFMESVRRKGGFKRFLIASFVIGAYMIMQVLDLKRRFDKATGEEKELIMQEVRRFANQSAWERTNVLTRIVPGEEKIPKIRTPELLATAPALLQMMLMERMFKDENVDFTAKEYAEASTEFIPPSLVLVNPFNEEGFIDDLAQFGFSWSTQWIKGIALPYLGFSEFPNIRSIEPAGSEFQPSQEVFSKNTTEIAKRLAQTDIAKEHDLTPIKIEAMIKGWFGSMSTYLTSDISSLDSWMKTFLERGIKYGTYVERYAMTGKIYSDFYKEKNRLTDAWNTRDISPISPDDAAKHFVYDNVGRILSLLRKKVKADEKIPAFVTNRMDDMLIALGNNNLKEVEKIFEELEKYKGFEW